MSDFQVTNGTVHYEHKKPMGQDYDNKQPSMTLHFTVVDGADHAVVAERVMATAQDIVERAIAGKITVQEAAKTAYRTGEVEVEGVMLGSTVPGRVGLSEVKRRGRPPANPTSNLATVVEDTSVAEPLTVSGDGNTQVGVATIIDDAPPANPPSPATVQEDATGPVDIATTSQDAAAILLEVEEDDLGIGTVVETGISDTELQKQAQKVSAHLRNKVNNINDLRKLIAVSQAEGAENGTLLTIPQEKRKEFIEKSKALLS